MFSPLPLTPWLHHRLLAGVGGVVVLMDQLSKAAVRARMDTGESVRLLGGVLGLSRVENRGIAWGLLSDSGARLPLMTAMTLLTMVALLTWFARLGPEDRRLAACLSLLLGGAAANFVDRLLYGRVTDFLAIEAPAALGGSWPVFNVADVCINVGFAAFVSLVVRPPSDGSL